MRIGTYRISRSSDWRASLLVTPDTVLDLADAAKALNRPVPLANDWRPPTDVVNWITPQGIDLARAILAASDGGLMDEHVRALAAVEHGPPMPRPGKFIAVGRNYMNHVREGQKIWAARGKVVALPTFPASFVKFASSIVAHGKTLVIPQGVENVDYEVELAFVIGRPAYRVPVERALEYIAGYTVCNDVGARAIQRLEMESQIGITLSKNFPSFAPLGPWLVTADEIPDPQRLEVSLHVNGEQRQHCGTADMIFPVAQLVSYWSQVGLEPGDMITTGTPAGVALAMPEPERYYLKPGDEVRASITRIGDLVNTVCAETLEDT